MYFFFLSFRITLPAAYFTLGNQKKEKKNLMYKWLEAILFFLFFRLVRQHALPFPSL